RLLGWDRPSERDPWAPSGVVSAMGLPDGQRETATGGLSGGSVPQRLGGPWAEAEWIPCRDGVWRPVEPGTCPLAHGVPARVGRLRGYGNAIVPQVAEE